MRFRALLFDFDGVIADTENIHIAAWQRTFAAMGWEVAEEVCARAMELDDRVFLAEVFASRKLRRGDIEGWVRRKQDLTRSLLAESPRVYRGVAALVDRLRGKVKLAVVSTTWRDNIVTVLKAENLYAAFNLIVAKEDTPFPKPDPAPYKLAIASLGLRAAEVVALEDSESGLASARAAGLRVVAVGHRLPEGTWIGTAAYLPDLTETERVLATIACASVH
jgi:HAD superfamily hydrolase (TIGR01509 family)